MTALAGIFVYIRYLDGATSTIFYNICITSFFFHFAIKLKRKIIMLINNRFQFVLIVSHFDITFKADKANKANQLYLYIYKAVLFKFI